MKKYICLIGIMLCISLFSEQHELLSEEDKKEVISEVKTHVNKVDFFIEASKYAKCQNIEFYRRENCFDLVDHYTDYEKANQDEITYLNCGIACCKRNWEVLNIYPLSNTLVNMDGKVCYEIICKKGNIYCGKYAVECELTKENGAWQIVHN